MAACTFAAFDAFLDDRTAFERANGHATHVAVPADRLAALFAERPDPAAARERFRAAGTILGLAVTVAPPGQPLAFRSDRPRGTAPRSVRPSLCSTPGRPWGSPDPAGEPTVG